MCCWSEAWSREVTSAGAWLHSPFPAMSIPPWMIEIQFKHPKKKVARYIAKESYTLYKIPFPFGWKVISRFIQVYIPSTPLWCPISWNGNPQGCGCDIHPGVDLTGRGYNHIGQMHQNDQIWMKQVFDILCNYLALLLVNEYQPLLCQVYLCNLNISEKTDCEIELSEKTLKYQHCSIYILHADSTIHTLAITCFSIVRNLKYYYSEKFSQLQQIHVHIYIYMCIFKYMYIYIYTRIFIYHIYIIYTYIFIYTNTSMYTYTFITKRSKKTARCANEPWREGDLESRVPSRGKSGDKSRYPKVKHQKDV